MDVTLYQGDCVKELEKVETASVDAVITDPPYPCIKRDYGYWTVEEWWAMIVEGVIPQVRRILKPTGSAVFILQPNSEHVGQMRGWLFEFQAWVCREWNMVQDVWWWNGNTLPSGVCSPRERGLLRASVKACVWAGTSKCYRNQDAVLWEESQNSVYRSALRRASPELYDKRKTVPSGQACNLHTAHDAALERGGVTPYNMLPFINAGPNSTGRLTGHGAGTPLKLADWWTRYIVPPGGTVCDPFIGSGTMGIAAMNNGCKIIGIEKMPKHFETAQRLIEKARRQPRQLELV
jgi:DNA modification methylase